MATAEEVAHLFVYLASEEVSIGTVTLPVTIPIYFAASQ